MLAQKSYNYLNLLLLQYIIVAGMLYALAKGSKIEIFGSIPHKKKDKKHRHE